MNQPFSVTARVWKEVPFEKGRIIHSLSDLLNENFQLAKYGNGVAEFNFTIIIEPQDFFPTKYRYSKKQKRIDAEIRVDYEQAIDSSLEAFKGLVAQHYLNIVNLLEKKNIEGFDLKHFRQDLEDFFAKQGGWSLFK